MIQKIKKLLLFALCFRYDKITLGGRLMYLLKVLTERKTSALDTPFDYLSKTKVVSGIRVHILFRNQLLVGYVLAVEEINQSKEEIEQERGYRIQYITDIIDHEPLLNEELQELSKTLSKLTLTPHITCLQTMLPTQLKPSTSKSVGIKYQKVVEVIDDTLILKTKKQQEALQYLSLHPVSKIKDIPYSKALLDRLEEQGAIRYKQIEAYRDPYQEMSLQDKQVTLTKDQTRVVNGILSKIDQYHTALIHGVTGSGKTEVYLKLSQYVIENQKTVLMLVPEISLTPMMVHAFKQRFGSKVAIIHSKLSQGERYDEYRRILNHEVSIVVGARSAIFAPLVNIGLIILDEEHDASYKQDASPMYHTTQIARIRGKTHQCPVVLGSASPSLESYSRAKKGVYDLYELPNRIHQHALPTIDIVDMAKEIKQKNYSLFSKALKDRIQETLDRNQQVILLLNKRGYASYVRCLDCGEVIKCPHCDVTLTYHKHDHKLRCHYCEYQEDLMKHCPNCNSDQLKTVGSGTQKVEEQLTSMFTNAKVIRYDVDTTRNKNGHLQLLEQFKNQEANILLGTQMIAKGLDFDNVTFVGVLNADISLNIPDFRANERTFQLLLQVAGRSGRGQKKGTVMIQTYNPDHYVLTCVKNHDYARFFEKEMEYRRLSHYPPYCHLVSILIKSKKEDLAEITAKQIKDFIQKKLPNTLVLGPASSYIYRMHDSYRQRILIKFKDSKQLYPVLQTMMQHYQSNHQVLVSCDFNPYSQI